MNHNPVHNPICPKGYKQTEVGVIPEDWNAKDENHMRSMKINETIFMKNPRPVFSGYVDFCVAAVYRNVDHGCTTTAHWNIDYPCDTAAYLNIGYPCDTAARRGTARRAPTDRRTTEGENES